MSKLLVEGIVSVQLLMVRLREHATKGQHAFRGQGMVEYALILAFIAILVIVALKFLQPSISRTLNNVSNSL